MRIDFDLNQQRGLACLVGLVGLIAEEVVHSAWGVNVDKILTGAFLTLAIGPVMAQTIEKIRRRPPPGSGRRSSDEPVPEDEPTDWPTFIVADTA